MFRGIGAAHDIILYQGEFSRQPTAEFYPYIYILKKKKSYPVKNVPPHQRIFSRVDPLNAAVETQLARTFLSILSFFSVISNTMQNTQENYFLVFLNGYKNIIFHLMNIV